MIPKLAIHSNDTCQSTTSKNFNETGYPEKPFLSTRRGRPSYKEGKNPVKTTQQEAYEPVYAYAREKLHEILLGIRDTTPSLAKESHGHGENDLGLLLALLRKSRAKGALEAPSKTPHLSQSTRMHHELNRRTFCDTERCETSASKSMLSARHAQASSIALHFQAFSTHHWIKAFKWAVSSLLSYRFLHTTLQLLRESSPHPLLLYCLNHPSTLSRLTRAQSADFMKQFLHKGFPGANPNVDSEVHSDNYLESNLLPHQKALLSLLAPSLMGHGLSRAVLYVERLLSLDTPMAFDILFSFLLRRRDLIPFSTSSSVTTQEESFEDLTLTSHPSSHFIRLLHMEFTRVDLSDFELPRSSLDREILFVFTDELQGYFDCLALVSSFNVEPFLLYARECQERTTPRSGSSGPFHPPSKVEANDRSTLASGRREAPVASLLTDFFVFSLLHVYHHLDFKACRVNLWNLYLKMSSLDPKVLDFTTGMAADDGPVTEEVALDSLPKASQEDLRSMNYLFLRTVLVLTTSLLGCITSFYRFSRDITIEPSDVEEICHMCDVMTNHYYVGLLHHFAASDDGLFLQSILCNNPSLFSFVRNLRCASLGLVIVLHQHHRSLKGASALLATFFVSRTEADGRLPQQFIMFHNKFCLLNLHPSFQHLIQPIGQVTHALLCAEMTQLLNDTSAQGLNTSSTCTPCVSRPPNENVELCNYSLSVIPSQCESLAYALKSLCGPSLSCPQTHADVQGYERDFSDTVRKKGLILWEHGNSSLPTFQSLDLAPQSTDPTIDLLPQNLHTRPVCWAYSVAGVLRHVFFDLLHTLVKTVELSQCRGVQYLIEFSRDLFQVDDEIARRVFSSSYSAPGYVVGCDNFSFWSLVVEQYLLRYLPYSFFSLTQVLQALLPKRFVYECTANRRLNEKRFHTVMALFTSPLSHLCFPPIAPGIHLLTRIEDHAGGGADREESHAFRQSPCLSSSRSRLNSCGETLSKAEQGACTPRLLQDTAPHNTSRITGNNLHHTRLIQEPSPQTPLQYCLEKPLVLESLVTTMMGLDSTTVDLPKETTVENLVGRVVSMPIEPVYCLTQDRVEDPPQAPTTHRDASLIDEEVQSPPNKARRYCGSGVWAVEAFRPHSDTVQSWSFPIDIWALDQFMVNFKSRRETETNYRKVHSQQLCPGFTLDPFNVSKDNDLQRIHAEAFLAYQVVSLAPGQDPPFTIQWRLPPSSCCTITPLQLLWAIGVTLLHELDQCTTLSGRSLDHLILFNELLKFFSTLLSLHSVSTVVLARFLLDDKDSALLSPIMLVFHFFKIMQLAVKLSQESCMDAEAAPCVTTLLMASLRLLLYALRPIHLDDLRCLLACSDAVETLCFFGAALDTPRITQLPLTLQPLGPETNHLYLHWLFCILCSSCPNTLVVNGTYMPGTPLLLVVDAIRRCATSGVAEELYCGLLLTSLEFVTSLLDLTPLTAWTRRLTDEALTVSQVTRESLNLLIRSQLGIDGEWKRVDEYLRIYEGQVWEIITCLLPPAIMTLTEPQEEEDDQMTVKHSLVNWCSEGVMELTNGAGFQMFAALVQLVFDVGWTQLDASLDVWMTFERVVLLRHLLTLLKYFTQVLTCFNCEMVDEKCQQLTDDPLFFSSCISGIRAIQQHLVKTFFEHNVFRFLTDMLLFEGYVSPHGLGGETGDPSAPKAGVDQPPHIQQMFMHPLLVEAYILDLLRTHHGSSTRVASSGEAVWGSVYYTASVSQEARHVVEHCYKFFISLCSSVYPPWRHSKGVEVSPPCAMFSPLAVMLEEMKNCGILHRSSGSCGLAYHLNSSVTPHDLFEQTDQRFVLDVVYGCVTLGWPFHVNLLMSLILPCTFWGDGVLSSSPVLLEWLMQTTFLSVAGAKETQPGGEVDMGGNEKSLVSFLLITHPSELDLSVSKYLKTQTKNSTKSVWTILTRVERTLVRCGLHTLVTVPCQLSMLFFPFCLAACEDRVRVSLIPSLSWVVGVFHLLGDSLVSPDAYGVEGQIRFCQNVMTFCLFWLARFLLCIEGGRGSPPKRVTLTVDQLRMVNLSLEMLNQLFVWSKRYTSGGLHLLDWLASPCEVLFRRVCWIHGEDLVRRLRELNGWGLVREILACLVRLWCGFETLRYLSPVHERLPTCDVSLAEQLLGRVVISSPLGIFSHEPLVAGWSACGVLDFTPEATQDPYAFTLCPAGEEDLFFVGCPLVMASFSSILALLSMCYSGESCCYATRESSFWPSLTLHGNPQVKKKTFHRFFLMKLVHLEEFIHLVQDMTHHKTIITSLLSPPQSSMATPVHQGCLVPSSLLAQLAPPWFRTMEKRHCFKVLPCPLCCVCAHDALHPFRAPLHQARLPVDCFLMDPECRLPEKSRHVLHYMHSLLFSHPTADVSTCTHCDKDHVDHLGQVAQGLCLGTKTTHAFLGTRPMVFSLSWISFGQYLWEKALERSSHGRTVPTLTTEEVNAYMFETFALIELMSVLSVELQINRSKHHLLYGLTEFESLLRRANTMLSHCRTTHDLPLAPLQLHRVIYHIKPFLKTLVYVFQKRHDLCGGGCDSFFCSNGTCPTRAISFVGLLLESAIQQLAGAWEHHKKTNSRETNAHFINFPPLSCIDPLLIKTACECSLSASSLACVIEAHHHSRHTTEEENATARTPPRDSETDQLLTQLLQQLWKHCLCTIRTYTDMEPVPEAEGFGFQSFTDFCRAFTCMHWIIRYWMIQLVCSIPETHAIDHCMTQWAILLAKALSILPSTASALMKAVSMGKENVDFVAQLLLLRSHTHPLARLSKKMVEALPEAYGPLSFFFLLSIPFLLMSLCCALLDGVRILSFCQKKTSTSQSSQEQNPPCFWTMDAFFHHTTQHGKKLFKGSLVAQLLRTIQILSQFPQQSIKAVDAIHFYFKQTHGFLPDLASTTLPTRANPTTPTVPHSTYRSICLSLESYCHRFNNEMCTISLSLLTSMALSPTLVKTMDGLAVASVLSLMPPVQLFVRPLVRSDTTAVYPHLSSTPRNTFSQGAAPLGPAQECWRPVYERFVTHTTSSGTPQLDHDRESPLLDAGSALPASRPAQLFRSRSHLVWCGCLSQLSCMTVECIVEYIVAFQRRFCFIFEAVTQSNQLGLLEEMVLIARLFSRLPPLHTLSSRDHQRTVLSLVFLMSGTVTHLTQQYLGQGQIEMAETFKPLSPQEVIASGLGDLETSGLDPLVEKGLDPRTFYSGQPAFVPSIFHQRVLVLTIKLIHRFFICTRRLQLERLDTHDLTHLNLDSFAQNCNQATHTSFLSFRKKHIHTLEDIFEHLFHDTLDIGRTVLQVLEDFNKQQKPIFSAVYRVSHSTIFIPLSLSLSCHHPITPDDLASLTQLKQPSSDTHTTDFSALDDLTSVTSPPFTSQQSTDNHPSEDHPPTTLTRHGVAGTTSIPSAQSHHPTPATKHHRSSVVDRSTHNPLRFTNLFQLYNDMSIRLVDDRDPKTDGCLPMWISFTSLLDVLHSTVASSAFLGFTYFNKLVHMTEKKVNGEIIACSHGHASMFERPSVVRRLTEFLTTLQSSGKDRFRSFHPVLKKLTKITSLRLGDDPKLLQRER